MTKGRKPPPKDDGGPTEITLERATDGSGHIFDVWNETPIREPEPARLPEVKLLTISGAKDASELLASRLELDRGDL